MSDYELNKIRTELVFTAAIAGNVSQLLTRARRIAAFAHLSDNSPLSREISEIIDFGVNAFSDAVSLETFIKGSSGNE